MTELDRLYIADAISSFAMISLQALQMVLETPSTYSLWLLLDNTSQSKLKAAILDIM